MVKNAALSRALRRKDQEMNQLILMVSYMDYGPQNILLLACALLGLSLLPSKMHLKASELMLSCVSCSLLARE